MVSSISGSNLFSQIALAEMRQRMFSNADTNSDGKISKDEMAKVVANMPQGGPSVDDIFSKLDTDGDGSVSKSEFETVMATGSDSVQSSNSEDKLLKTLLEALENETKTDSSTSVSASQNGSSATSTAAMLSSVLKAYMQSSYSSWSQTDVQSLLGAAVQV